MNKKMNIFFASFALTLLIASCSVSVFSQDKTAVQIPKEVKDAVGTYTGSWTSYSLDANGQVIKQAAWTDVMKAENPVVEKNRAYVATTDDMTFEGGRIPPMKVPGKEGYLLNSDGSIGEYFIETYGQTYRMQKIGDNVLAYTIAAAPQELARLGIPSAISAQHVLVKVISLEQGMETHNISRITTVRWKDATGKDRTTQFVSLQGQHQRKLK
ncbi:MAG TPA: hypothetical protein VF596_06160 [Pyrinomonadaceae bacterium]|jgi:hypothetical protein